MYVARVCYLLALPSQHTHIALATYTHVVAAMGAACSDIHDVQSNPRRAEGVPVPLPP